MRSLAAGAAPALRCGRGADGAPRPPRLRRRERVAVEGAAEHDLRRRRVRFSGPRLFPRRPSNNRSAKADPTTCAGYTVMDFDPRILRQLDAQPYPLLFATISGAHLYGFPSPDSDYDLRGAHVLPLEEVVGLDAGLETIELSGVYDGL